MCGVTNTPHLTIQGQLPACARPRSWDHALPQAGNPSHPESLPEQVFCRYSQGDIESPTVYLPLVRNARIFIAMLKKKKKKDFYSLVLEASVCTKISYHDSFLPL